MGVLWLCVLVQCLVVRHHSIEDLLRTDNHRECPHNTLNCATNTTNTTILTTQPHSLSYCRTAAPKHIMIAQNARTPPLRPPHPSLPSRRPPFPDHSAAHISPPRAPLPKRITPACSPAKLASNGPCFGAIRQVLKMAKTRNSFVVRRRVVRCKRTAWPFGVRRKCGGVYIVPVPMRVF